MSGRINPFLSSLPRRRFFRFSTWLLTSVLSFFILISPISLRAGISTIIAGEVASQDIQAPYTASFTSIVLTDRAKQEASASVAPVYLPPDPAIRRTAVDTLRTTLEAVTRIRDDELLSEKQKILNIAGISNLPFSTETANQILLLTEINWERDKQESLRILEEIMRRTIREADVNEIQKSIPLMIDYSLPSYQVELISQIVAPLITANSFFSPELTVAAQKQAADNTSPVMRNFVRGQNIIRQGQILREEDIEVLTQFGYLKPDQSPRFIGSAAAMILVIAAFVLIYAVKRKHSTLEDIRTVLLISIAFLIFLVAARITVPNRTVIPYLFPLAAFGMTIAAAFSIEIGIIFTVILSILAGFGVSDTPELIVYYILTGLVSVIILGRARRFASYVWSGLAASVTGILVILAYRLQDPLTDMIGIITLIAAAIFYGIASASITLILQYVFSLLLGVTTGLQLLEISRPDHPLLQFMLRTAPGSYQHSLQVANLAEQAAEAINADSLLVRVGALYHDVGKSMNSQFFIENLLKGSENPHEKISPEQSAKIIIQHIEDGQKLAAKHRIPSRIQSFITEHHGTLITRYQYNRAVEANGGDTEKVDPEDFRYPGPTPRSRETAILMLADGCEAKVRAEIPQNEEELRKVLQKVFDYILKEKQLNQAKLTMLDLTKIQDSFTATLMGVYHQRIVYPEVLPTV